MRDVFVQLISLCAVEMISEQLTAGTRLKDGVRMICGVIAARLMLEAALALPGMIFG